MFKCIRLAVSVFFLAGQSAQAAPCAALADFFGRVVKASGAEVKPERFKEQVTSIKGAKKYCGPVVAQMADTQVYSHALGVPLQHLQEYLKDDARFEVRVIGRGDKVELIDFDIDEVGVLRRRPTR